MPLLDLNLGGVASAGTPLPEGEYSFLIESAVIKLSAKGDSHNLKLRLTVVSENENGRPHSENLNIQESTKPFVKAFLTALWGVEDDEVDDIQFDYNEEDGTVISINEREVIGLNIGGFIKHTSVKKDETTTNTYANVNAWFSV